MNIAIISDTHFGFSHNSERREDSFIQGKEAIEKALEQKVDLILLAGDIFDSRVPTQDVLGKVMQILQKPLETKSEVKFKYAIGKDEKEIAKTALSGTPVIAIHGTHERRGRGLTNPIQVLEKAGLLIHLHCNSIVFEKGSEKIAIHGMSGVPERYAKIVLEKWNPKAVPDINNVLVLHQSIEQYVYSESDIPTLRLEDLPKGFDLIVNGHIHWSEFRALGNSKFLLPGSTIRTQLRKIESEKSKGFYLFESKTKKLDFIELKTPREFYYKTLDMDKAKPREVLDKIEKELEKIKTGEKKPLVIVKLKGSLKTGFSTEDLDITGLEKRFRDTCIVKIDKGKLSTKELIQRRELLEQLKSKQLSVDELGLELLKKHLNELKYRALLDPETLLNKLAEGETDLLHEEIRRAGNGRKRT